MPTVSTHVLDAAGGGPRAGVEVILRDAAGEVVARGRTGPDGRVSALGEAIPAGTYCLSWWTGGSILAEVAVRVHLLEDRHYHLPLLAAPASAVAYLGV